MHFDDRLATVLRHRATGERAARTQYRQLLDLLGQRRHGRDENLAAAAWLRLGALGETIPAAERAAIVREPGWRFANPELAAHLAEDEPPVAAAALAAAVLSEEDWTALIPRLPIRARGFLRLRQDLPPAANRVLDRLGVSDRALPLPERPEPFVLTDEAPAEPPAPGAVTPGVVMPFPANDALQGQPREIPHTAPPPPRPTAIAALVERIEAFQRNRGEPRDTPSAENDSHPALPFLELQQPRALQDDDDGLAFTTDADGRIDWAEEAVAPMLRYLPLREVLGRDAQLAMQRRLPLAAVLATLEGAPRIAGRWHCDAAPRFDPLGGRFVGYAGRLRRASNAELQPEDDGDRIRQLLHELRTPVNAIQGFAEVIHQQLFGPVPHEYRALAATIAGDAARILAGFDELDRLAKLESGARTLDPGASDFSAIVAGQLQQLAVILAPRDARFDAAIAAGCQVGLGQNDAEAICWRVLASVGSALGPGETVTVRLGCSDGSVMLECTLPAAWRPRDDVFASEALRPASGSMLSPGSFGSGFALRLARAEARSAGGQLARAEERLTLTLPLLTAQEADSSAASTGT